MLFGVTYTEQGANEADQARSLQLFTSWQPPIEFKHHWAHADGSGGFAIVETDSAAALLEAVAAFTPFFDFKVTPVVEITDAVPVFAKVNAWRDSVG